MTEQANYQFNLMPFELKNTCAAYQKIVNKVFREEISKMLEVYMDGVILNSISKNLMTNTSVEYLREFNNKT